MPAGLEMAERGAVARIVGKGLLNALTSMFGAFRDPSYRRAIRNK